CARASYRNWSIGHHYGFDSW
nr:immunoglobulin heavy chain junction region [Macaca mulatta]MOV38335.1 immunoglobulin heavy chain junction region [Macaca mulatta]MOV39274.1 immunoglobulin heavy chain junction region [Macaca mulatta]MOV39423.1 immunoglobulin heavy chain junction region [Macaca mulatta]MOV39725.1 immunoglobulin heavy chain junction region [Macaca mulatta]